MTNRIKVVPNTPDAVGMRHPLDGPLTAEGSLWAYDTFTLQRLHAGSIRHFETQADVEAEAEAEAEAETEAGPVVGTKASKASKAAAAAAAAAAQSAT